MATKEKQPLKIGTKKPSKQQEEQEKSSRCMKVDLKMRRVLKMRKKKLFVNKKPTGEDENETNEINEAIESERRHGIGSKFGLTKC